MPRQVPHTVLIPGLLCSPRLYDQLLPIVWARGAVTIADTRRDESIPGMAERLLAQAPPRFVLVAVSMGGYVALEVLRRAPERVIGVGLISTSARPDTSEQQASRRAQSAQALGGGFAQLVDAVFPVLVDESNTGDVELLRVWRQMAFEVGPQVFAQQNTAAAERLDAKAVLPTIAVPTAVVHGRGDRLIPVESGEEMARSIPGARLTLLDGVGHLALLERPQPVAAAIDALLDDLEP